MYWTRVGHNVGQVFERGLDEVQAIRDRPTTGLDKAAAFLRETWRGLRRGAADAVMPQLEKASDPNASTARRASAAIYGSLGVVLGAPIAALIGAVEGAMKSVGRLETLAKQRQLDKVLKRTYRDVDEARTELRFAYDPTTRKMTQKRELADVPDPAADALEQRFWDGFEGIQPERLAAPRADGTSPSTSEAQPETPRDLGPHDSRNETPRSADSTATDPLGEPSAASREGSPPPGTPAASSVDGPTREVSTIIQLPSDAARVRDREEARGR